MELLFGPKGLEDLEICGIAQRQFYESGWEMVSHFFVTSRCVKTHPKGFCDVFWMIWCHGVWNYCKAVGRERLRKVFTLFVTCCKNEKCFKETTPSICFCKDLISTKWLCVGGARTYHNINLSANWNIVRFSKDFRNLPFRYEAGLSHFKEKW